MGLQVPIKLPQITPTTVGNTSSFPSPPNFITKFFDALGNVLFNSSAAKTRSVNNTQLVASPTLKTHANVTTPQSIANRFEDGSLPLVAQRERAIDRGSRPPTPKFSDIGQVGDVSNYVRANNDAGTKDIEDGLKIAQSAPGPAGAAASTARTALLVTDTIAAVGDMVLASGNAAGLSPQQLEYIYTGKIDGQPVATALPITERLALAEGRGGTKQLMMPDGSYVTVGGTSLGGPGFTMLDDADTSPRVGRAIGRISFGSQ